MKKSLWAMYGIGVCIATAAAVWFSTTGAPHEAVVLTQQVTPSTGNSRISGDPASQGLARGEGVSSTAVASRLNDALELLMAQVMTATYSPAEAEAAREKLRSWAREDPAVAQWLLQSYDKPYNSRSRGLIISLLLEIKTPEVLAFAKRLASSNNLEQQRDGFVLLQNLPSDLPEMRPIILQALSGNQASESVLLALAALKPPTPSGSKISQKDIPSTYAAAVVAKLQNLTRHAAPEVRTESVLQLAQWDQTGGSQEQWATALADQSPRVREAAVVAIAQSGAKSDLVKAALLRMASNPKESNDVRGNALQVLEDFSLSKEEARDISQWRAQMLGK